MSLIRWFSVLADLERAEAKLKATMLDCAARASTYTEAEQIAYFAVLDEHRRAVAAFNAVNLPR